MRAEGDRNSKIGCIWDGIVATPEPFPERGI